MKKIKKMKFKIIGIIVGMFILIGVVYAGVEQWRVDNSTGYRINNGVTLNIDRGAKCRKVKNTSGSAYFVPIKTNTEWYSFVGHKPSGTTVTNECYISKGYDKGTSFWRRGPGAQFEVCYHGKCINGFTSGESASVYRYWKDGNGSYPASANEFSGWTVHRGSFHHSSGGSNYYYVTIAE